MNSTVFEDVQHKLLKTEYDDYDAKWAALNRISGESEGSPEIVAVLVEFLESEQQQSVMQFHAATVMATSCSRHCAEQVKRLSTSPRPETRQCSIRSIAVLIRMDKVWLDSLLRLCADTDAVVRDMAFRSFLEYVNESRIDILELLQVSTPIFQAIGVYAQSRLSRLDDTVLSVAEQLLASGERNVQEFTLLALLGTPRVSTCTMRKMCMLIQANYQHLSSKLIDSFVLCSALPDEAFAFLDQLVCDPDPDLAVLQAQLIRVASQLASAYDAAIITLLKADLNLSGLNRRLVRRLCGAISLSPERHAKITARLRNSRSETELLRLFNKHF